MAITNLSDVVNSASMQAFAQFFDKAYHDNSTFLKSGIAATDPLIAARCATVGFGGKTVNMPFWGDLRTASRVATDTSDLPVNGIATGQDVAVIQRRETAFGVTDLAVDLAGDDPMAWIASRLGAYWAREDETRIIKTLQGIFASTGAGANLILDISGESGDAAILGKDTLIWAAQKLGDKKGNLTAVAMNSYAEAFLASLDAQSTLYRPSDAKGTLPTYNGKSIVMDDNLNYDTSTKVAEIYLFGAGAVALNDVPVKNGFEAGRDPLVNGGQDYVVSRHHNIAHVRGMAWAGTASGVAPTDTELSTAENWTKVYDDKDIRVVKLVCKLG